jgi:hypothetical protein
LTEFLTLPLHVEESNQVIPKIKISLRHGSFRIEASRTPNSKPRRENADYEQRCAGG